VTGSGTGSVSVTVPGVVIITVMTIGTITVTAMGMVTGTETVKELGEIRISRTWAMPNKWTFAVAPIRKLVLRYVKGDTSKWADLFPGDYSIKDMTLAEDALGFCESLRPSTLCGAVIDPPYSSRQVTECYKGRNCKQITPILDLISKAVMPNGIVISFGWNSNGMGMTRGFMLVEVLLVAHGAQHNDTIVTVEQKQ